MIAQWFNRLDPPPDVFAIVMASGIVSMAAADHGYRLLSTGLLGVAVIAFVLLGLGFVIRASTSPRRVSLLARDPDVAMRMFTFVSACAVLDARGSAFGSTRWLLAGLGTAVWLVLLPLAAVDLCSRSPVQLRDSVHGAWLLPSVATSGLAILSADLAGPSRSSAFLLMALVAWIAAASIYLAVTGLIGWRVIETRFRLDGLGPDSWILMGALAICALAGGHIHAALRAAGGPLILLRASHLMIVGPLVLASGWIPVLLYAEMWRADHVVGALRYHRAWWSAVFPIGMYSATSDKAGQELDLPALRTVSLVFFWIALTVWLMVAAGLAHTTVARSLRGPTGLR